MKNRLVILPLCLLFTSSLLAQTRISGKVSDAQGEVIPGANVYLKDTFDGINTSSNGSFTFESVEQGSQVLVISFIGYKTQEKPIELKGEAIYIEVVLIEEINKLDGVTISAGAFETSDVKKVTVLKPLDIVTTASAAGDIMGAINTLPGTATVGESGRLFVRGGEGYETKVFIDGMEVRNAFGATTPNVPTRGRFSPFLFKGTVFTTGGYSAEYGQALSSALILNSNDVPEKTQADISLMSVGGDVAYTKKWEKTSVSGKLQYTNLRPYQNLISQYFDWEKAPLSTTGEFIIRQQVRNNGLLKLYANISRSDFTIRQPNINREGIKDTISIANDYFYLNTNYKDVLNSKWSIKAGVSTTFNDEAIGFNNDGFGEKEKAAHGKLALNWDTSEKITVNFGSEFYHKNYERQLYLENGAPTNYSFNEELLTSYAEGDYFASNAFVIRMGLRLEHSTLLRRTWLSPRIAMSYKLNEKGQFSFAYGRFLQSSQNNYVLINNKLAPEEATHYILNYQHIYEGRVFRVEAYSKQYDNLVKYQDLNNYDPFQYTNSGFGKARGVDFFWRDSKSFDNTDYWISYSYLDSERNYRDFPLVATPSFVSAHNFSFVIKHFVDPIRTQFGATYNFASNRPFHNPNKQGFQNDRTPEFHDLSLNAAILIKQNIILYLSSSNVFGRDNIFGYQYANERNGDGVYPSQAIRQAAKRFLFVGLFITLSKNGQENQLENL